MEVEIVSTEFQIETQWLARHAGAVAERGTFAVLSMRARDVCLTRVEDRRAGSVLDHIYVSAFPLAEWMLHSWWRLLYEPQVYDDGWLMAHSIAAAGHGYSWPNLIIASDDAWTTLNLIPHRSPLEPIRYLESGEVVISLASFENEALGFLRRVDSRLHAQQISAEAYSAALRRLEEERCDPDVVRWRKYEAMSGHDVDEAPEAFIEALHKSASHWGESAVDELAAAFRDDAVTRIDNLGELEGKSVEARFPKELRGSQEQPEHPVEAWKLAEANASHLRGTLGLNGGLVDNQKLEEILSVQPGFFESDASAPGLGMSAGFLEPGEAAGKIYLDKKWHTGRRFEAARLIADLQRQAPDDRVLPVTESSTYRQKYQRAFAREFLLPTEALEEFADTSGTSGDAIENLAAEYEVSPRLVSSALVNKGLAERETLAVY